MPRRIVPAPYHSGRPKSKLVNLIICNDHGFKPAAHERSFVAIRAIIHHARQTFERFLACLTATSFPRGIKPEERGWLDGSTATQILLHTVTPAYSRQHLQQR